MEHRKHRLRPSNPRAKAPGASAPPPDPRRGPPAAPSRTEDPEVIRVEKVDPSTQTPVDEPEDTEQEGQEGVGPGPREAVRRQEKGEPSPEEEP